MAKKMLSDFDMDYGSQAFADYTNELKSILPIDTEEKAKQYRDVYNKYHANKIIYPIPSKKE